MSEVDPKPEYSEPQRKIRSVFDIGGWYKSEAYANYLAFLKRLSQSVRSQPTQSDVEVGEVASRLTSMLGTFDEWIEEYPPEDMAEQRYGNRAFKKWHSRLESEVDGLVGSVLGVMPASKREVIPYLLDGFGNSTRIDYGSGHEASFLIFLLCLYEIGLLKAGEDDKAIVLRVFYRYLRLVRHLQRVYRMEPAGSRGVHCLDDYQFAPFIFGSSQLIDNRHRLIPDYYLRAEIVEQHQSDDLFFEAIQFINETKTGPFYEHSNQLYNISAVPTWEKINSGLFKMYEAEVLKKFPVVQHFLFGRLFSFNERAGVDKVQRDMSGIEKVAKNQHPTSLGPISE